jgi:hypothetical protein
MSTERDAELRDIGAKAVEAARVMRIAGKSGVVAGLECAYALAVADGIEMMLEQIGATAFERSIQ